MRACLLAIFVTGAACVCQNGSYLATSYLYNFDSNMSLFNPNLVTRITNTSKCKFGDCILSNSPSFSSPSGFSTSVFPDPNVYTMTFWYTYDTLPQTLGPTLLQITGPSYKGTGNTDVLVVFSWNGFAFLPPSDAITPSEWGMATLNWGTPTAWNHIAFVVTYVSGNSSQFSIYINSKFVASVVHPWTRGASNVGLFGIPMYYDDLVFFPYALSADDILLLYNNTFRYCLICPENHRCDGGKKTPCAANYVSAAGSSNCSAGTVTTATTAAAKTTATATNTTAILIAEANGAAKWIVISIILTLIVGLSVLGGFIA